MQFIGLGFRKSDQVNPDRIRDKASTFNLLASTSISRGTFEEGLTDFSKQFNLLIMQFSAFNERDKKMSSDQISDELSLFYEGDEKNDFLNFLSTGFDFLPEVYYVIFAIDWNAGDPIRLKRLRYEGLKPYFKQTNSWYPWRYNYSTKRYYAQLDLPLILEVT